MNRSLLYQIYEKVERRVAPTLKYSEYFYEEVLRETLGKDVSWLDVGCGYHVLALWREDEEKKLVQKARFVVGLDVDWPSLRRHRSIKNRVRGEVSALPFREDTFDLVTANMVVEHLERPEAQFCEIRRVLKPGGVFLFHTPNAYSYPTVFARMIPERWKAWLIQLLEGRSPEDVFTTHYRANTESQIRRLSQEAGLEVAKIRYIASSAKAAVILPVAVFELLWLRLLLTRPFQLLRTNLLVTLAKPSPSGLVPNWVQ
jgi:SAM-dependent methyltransferase